nr:MAG TPA: hypothetical protein [Caudoviricetes sp.]
MHKVIFCYNGCLARYFITHSLLYQLWCTSDDIGYLFGVHKKLLLKSLFVINNVVFLQHKEARLIRYRAGLQFRREGSNKPYSFYLPFCMCSLMVFESEIL